MRKYTPEKIDNSEFHRIREWYNTFNAFVQGVLASGELVYSYYDRKDLRKRARRFANSVHGSILKTRPVRTFNPEDY